MADRVQVHGSAEWEAALDRKQAAVERITWRATAQAAAFVERQQKKILRTYTHPEGTPTTSPPGHPPALVTGNLMRSVRTSGPHRGRRPKQVVARIGPTAKYSRIQELGGRIHNAFGKGLTVELPARPYVEPVVQRLRTSGDIRRIYARHWRSGLLA